MNARIFVGPSLCRNKQWLDTSIDFSTCIFLATGYLKIVPWFMRPIVAPLVPYIRRIHRHHQTARDLLIPELMRRRAQAANAHMGSDKKPDDMLQWIEDESSGEDLRPERNVDRQLGLCFGATDGTTNLIVNVIYDLAARWSQYGPELRSEIEDSLREDEGAVRQSTVNRLSKLDSFMKESQRLNPLSARTYPICYPVY
jgi:cytochrome P450